MVGRLCFCASTTAPTTATIDFALSAEHRSFDSPELRANLDRFLAPKD